MVERTSDLSQQPILCHVGRLLCAVLGVRDNAQGVIEIMGWVDGQRLCVLVGVVMGALFVAHTCAVLPVSPSFYCRCLPFLSIACICGGEEKGKVKGRVTKGITAAQNKHTYFVLPQSSPKVSCCRTPSLVAHQLLPF